MILSKRPKTVTTNQNSIYLIGLSVQTGMPLITASRSKEVLYDSLYTLPTFIQNPYGPQPLFVARPQYHW